MASGIPFYYLCLWLLLGLTITQSSAKYIEVPSRDDPNLLCFMEYSARNCRYESYIFKPDICPKRKMCYQGPNEECRKNDETLKCHPDLNCSSCNICVGCYGDECTDVRLCPSHETKLKRWRKRFERNYLGLDV